MKKKVKKEIEKLNCELYAYEQVVGVLYDIDKVAELKCKLAELKNS